MLSLKINNLDIPVVSHKFTDGAIGVQLEGTLPRQCESAQIYAPLTGCPQNMLFEIKCLVDILRTLNSRIYIQLFMPYLPYARQDRRMVRNDALTLRIYVEDINSLNLDSVVVMDVHSDAGVIGLNNVTHIEQASVISVNPLRYRLSMQHNRDSNPVIVAPDAGALKKINKVAGVIPHSGIVILGKERNIETRELGAMKVLDSTLYRLEDRRAVIFDDLCDGGRTFMQAATLLKELGAEEVDLYITHGIFSYGVSQIFEAGVSTIFTTDSVQLSEEARAHSNVIALDCMSIAKALNIRGF